MRAAACAASSLANNWNLPSRAARRIERRKQRRWWRKKGVVGATDHTLVALAVTVVVVVVVVVVGSQRVELPITGAALGSRNSPRSSSWRLAGAARFRRGLWRAGPPPSHGIPVSRV